MLANTRTQMSHLVLLINGELHHCNKHKRWHHDRSKPERCAKRRRLKVVESADAHQFGLRVAVPRHNNGLGDGATATAPVVLVQQSNGCRGFAGRKRRAERIWQRLRRFERQHGVENATKVKRTGPSFLWLSSVILWLSSSYWFLIVYLTLSLSFFIIHITIIYHRARCSLSFRIH